ncbi:MAG TPA: aldo/keto reductase [Terriglobia bacterium]|nr:aldo/keto reductase [Terriglobia bacterium]
MNYRELGRTGWKVSEISFGAWAIGSMWGSVDEKESIAALHKALDVGINFFDTADVYGDGRSERLLGRLRKERQEPFYIATKAGRRLPSQTLEGYNRENLTRFVEDSLRNLQMDCVDIVQLHCPPNKVYYTPEAFEALEGLVRAGKIRHYGVSVRTCEEGLKALEYPGIQSVQIIFNLFRHRPSELFFPEAKRHRVGILARVPLASGMLTGRMSRETTFAQDDHRSFNREGAKFDKGETFSGVDYNLGLAVVDQLRPLVPERATMAQFALRWILMFDAVTCAIPGGKRPSQVEDNARASALPPLSDEVMHKVRELYDTRLRELVHQRW